MPIETSVFGQIKSDIANKKYSHALSKLSNLSNEYSKDVNYLMYLSQVLQELGDLDALIKCLKTLNQFAPSTDVELKIMGVLYKNSQINEALDIGISLQEKKLSRSQKTELLYNLIKIYVEENDFEGVQELIEQNEQLVMQNDFMLWASGLAHIVRNDHNKALNCFRKAIAVNPKNDQVWVSLALLHQEMSDDELALANLEKALDINPLNNAAVKLYSQWSLRKADKTQSALGKIRFYLSEHEFDEEISVCHYQLLCRLKQWSQAEFEVNKLIWSYPSNLNYSEMKKNLEQNLNV